MAGLYGLKVLIWGNRALIGLLNKSVQEWAILQLLVCILSATNYINIIIITNAFLWCVSQIVYILLQVHCSGDGMMR